MEYALEDTVKVAFSKNLIVLILVLMEYALEVPSLKPNLQPLSSLNPCFNGICSRSERLVLLWNVSGVLILVLMEYALEVEKALYDY